MDRVYDRLEKAGVKGIERDKTIAGYAPGTRMAQIGYVNQEKQPRGISPAEARGASVRGSHRSRPV